jgi:hypothetical protein
MERIYSIPPNRIIPASSRLSHGLLSPKHLPVNFFREVSYAAVSNNLDMLKIPPESRFILSRYL